MKFFDEVHIKVKSWSGWDWIISGRREKHVPFGWPSWGNGWKWWSVIIVWTSNERTLMPYRYNLMYKAKDWMKGWSKEQYGADAENIYLKVPLWTIIKDTKTQQVIWSISEQDQEIEIAQWWKGGVWNMHFVTPQVQYPEIALHWEPGQQREITLELQLLADVALVWLPSVWKSSLINAVSNVKAKTAEYHFTTLVPNIWIVQHKSTSFTLIDVPWLIVWASSGKWLWIDFLRHILKSRVLCFMVDMSKYENWFKDFNMCRNEWCEYLLKKFPWSTISIKEKDNNICMELNDVAWEVLLEKIITRVANKSDVLQDDELAEDFMWVLAKYLQKWLDSEYWLPKDLVNKNVFWLSTVSRNGIDKRLDKIIGIVNNISISNTSHLEPSFSLIQDPEPKVTDITTKELEFLKDNNYLQEDQNLTKVKVREVFHTQIGYLSFVVPRWNQQAELRYRQKLDQQWHLGRLQWFGVKKWHILKVKSFYTWLDDKYILRD